MNIRIANNILVFCLLLAGCGHSWGDYDMSLYRSMKESTPEAQDAHARLLAALIAEAEEDGCKPPPGICAEYAYYLGKLQKSSEASRYLAKELAYYAESATFVQIMQRLMEGAKHVLTNQPAGNTPPAVTAKSKKP